MVMQIDDLSYVHSYNDKEWEQLRAMLGRLYAPDWVKIEEGWPELKEQTIIEIYDATLGTQEIVILGGFGYDRNKQSEEMPHITHWRYATPPPTETT
jgi:hypothetical protein